MSKIIFAFIIVGLQCGPLVTFAIPLPAEEETKAIGPGEIPFFNGPSASFCEFVSKISYGPWMLVPLLILYSEIFTVASGVHSFPFVSTPSMRAADRDQQLIAVASTNLWNRLPLMEDVNNIFLNSSWSALATISRKNISTLTEMGLDDILFEVRSRMFQNIEKTFLTNASLVTFYHEEKDKVGKLLLPPIENFTLYSLGIDGKLISTHLIQKYPLSRSFVMKLPIPLVRFATCISDSVRNKSYGPGLNLEINLTDSKALQIFALSEAIMQWSKTDKASRVQHIVDEIARNSAQKFYTTNDAAIFLDYFFPTLEEEFKKVPELDAEFTVIRNNLVKKYSSREASQVVSQSQSL